MHALRILLFAAAAALAIAGCNTTLDFGYYVESLDDEGIYELFEVSDEAIANRDHSTYSGLFGPNFTTTNQASDQRMPMNRTDYLEAARQIFRSATELEVRTMITDIEYVEPGRRALVTVQAEERRRLYGTLERITSRSEVEIGFEDGWIFFAKDTRTAQQIIPPGADVDF